MIKLKRAYEPPEEEDGLRVLVDGIWPRGVSKEEAALHRWMREVAPSDELRRWFDHDPEKWDEFRERYARELDEKPDQVALLKEMSRDGTLTLVYGARNTEHNQAVALKGYLEEG